MDLTAKEALWLGFKNEINIYHNGQNTGQIIPVEGDLKFLKAYKDVVFVVSTV